MNKYEAMVIIKPDLSEDERKNACSQINDAVTKHKGNIIQSGVWSEKRKFTFPIKKAHEGVSYLVNFMLPAAAVGELQNTYRLNENILRTLIIKSDK